MLTLLDFDTGSTNANYVGSMLSSEVSFKVGWDAKLTGAPLAQFLQNENPTLDLPNVLKHGHGNSQLLCASGAQEFASLCGSGTSIQWDQKRFSDQNGQVWLDTTTMESAFLKEHRQGSIKLLDHFVAIGGSAQLHKSAAGDLLLEAAFSSLSATFDLSSKDDLMLFMELQLFATIPLIISSNATLAHMFRDSSPDLLSLTISGLKALKDTHGRQSHKFRLAQAIVDSSIKLILGRFSGLVPRQLISEVISVKSCSKNANVSHSKRHAGRRLLATSVASADPAAHSAAHPNTPSLERPDQSFAYNCNQTSLGDPAQVNYCPPLIDDISAYQIFVWTAVALFLMLYAAVSSLANMDLGYDSLLYAKFQADTHGKTD